MNISRRNFLGGLGAAGASIALPGCCFNCCCAPKAKIGLQLYSIRHYIGGLKDKEGKLVKPGVGLAQALKDVASIGYKGVEFAGYYGNDPNTLKAMLDDAGLVACGTHVGKDAFSPENVKATCEFNLGYGNNVIICPGGGNAPKGFNWSNPGSAQFDDFFKELTEYYAKAAEDAAAFGCRIGLHNHQWEFQYKMADGRTMWDYFFTNTPKNVVMEQDVGWTTCAGYDPCEEYKKYPGRSPTLHAKENGMGKGVKQFDAILGRPGLPGAKGVEWDRLIPVTEKDGVEWYVVECERHAEDLSAVTPSYAFLKAKGLN